MRSSKTDKRKTISDAAQLAIKSNESRRVYLKRRLMELEELGRPLREELESTTEWIERLRENPMAIIGEGV